MLLPQVLIKDQRILYSLLIIIRLMPLHWALPGNSNMEVLTSKNRMSATMFLSLYFSKYVITGLLWWSGKYTKSREFVHYSLPCIVFSIALHVATDHILCKQYPMDFCVYSEHFEAHLFLHRVHFWDILWIVHYMEGSQTVPTRGSASSTRKNW